ncbi:MAG: serine/threonine-protein kinase, partial [Candidatus Binatia bacterium]
YRIVDELASGGQARVLLVEDGDARKFVVKLYHDRAFAAKAEVLERAQHFAAEHVVALVEHGVSDDYPYEVLEYLPLGTLAELFARSDLRLPPDRVRELLAELAGALGHIHERGVEHKDLKPTNVLVRSERPLDLVLADFGIAAASAASVRASTVLGGTYAYAPPESLGQTTERDASGATKRRVLLHATKWDYWSLGMIVVEALTGRSPFEGCDPMVVANRLATQSADDYVADVKDLQWRKLCRGLLRRDPKQRWGKSEVERWLADPNDPALVVAEDLPAASAGFRFLGKDFHTKEDLAAAFAENWEDAEGIWRRQNQRLRDWVKHDLGLMDLAAELERLDRTPNLDLNQQVFSMIAALDPSRPPTFRGV